MVSSVNSINNYGTSSAHQLYTRKNNHTNMNSLNSKKAKKKVLIKSSKVIKKYYTHKIIAGIILVLFVSSKMYL